MKIIEWLTGILFLIALIDFVPNPRKALSTIPDVLSTNPRMVNGHLKIYGPRTIKKKLVATPKAK